MQPDGASAPNLSAVEPSEDPGGVQGAPADPRDSLLEACATAIERIAKRVVFASSPDEVKGYGAGAESFARAMSLINPPMKPIDPNLHASKRGVDPQAVFDAATAADKQAADQQHALEKQAADQAHQAGMAAMQQAAQPEKPKPQQ